MTTRLLKEFRQLLPAWCVAMLLAAVPAHFNGSSDQPELKIAAYVFGLLCLAVSSFGPEFSHRTFAMLMAQPVPRVRLWREKSNTLLVAAAVVVLTFCLSTMTFSRGKVETIAVAVVLAPVLVAGGLWMALAFRQVVIAFFFAMCLPVLLSGVSSAITETWLHPWSLEIWCATMLIYAVLAFWFARRLFLGAQDYHWTGSEIAFDFKFLGRQSSAGSVPTRQAPVWALVKKEILFQQSSLICALVVAGVTVIAVVLGKLTGALQTTLAGQFFVGFAIGFPLLGCFVLPLLTGALSIAEERRLGTLDTQQSLPVSRWYQFVVKGAATFLLSIALGAILPWFLIEAVQAVLGNQGGPSSDQPTFGFLLCAAMVMTTLAFYASSLTRSTIHAVVLAVGLVTIPLGFALARLMSVVSRERMGFDEGETLLWLIGVPVGIAVLVRLSFTNFCSPGESWSLWWRNLWVWLASAAAVAGVWAAVQLLF